MFISYGLEGVGYKFYDLDTKKLVNGCDVEVIEDQWLKDIASANVSCEPRQKLEKFKVFDQSNELNSDDPNYHKSS